MFFATHFYTLFFFVYTTMQNWDMAATDADFLGFIFLASSNRHEKPL